MPDEHGRLTLDETQSIQGGRAGARGLPGIENIFGMEGQSGPDMHVLESTKNMAQLEAVTTALRDVHSAMLGPMEAIYMASSKTNWDHKIGGGEQTFAGLAKALGVPPGHIGSGAEPIGKAGFAEIGAALDCADARMQDMLNQVQLSFVRDGKASEDTTRMIDRLQHSVVDMARALGMPTGR